MKMESLIVVLLAVYCMVAEAQIPEAPPEMEKRITIGCAVKAEHSFYIAQEKIYKVNNIPDLKEFLKRELNVQEYALMANRLLQLEKWVDRFLMDFPDSKAKDVGRSLFYTCIKNSYEGFGYRPSPELNVTVHKFERMLKGVQEDFFPYRDRVNI